MRTRLLGRDTRLSRWLQSRIPPVSATELGVFRVLFGAALAWIVWDMRLPVEAFPQELHLRAHPLAQWEWVHTLAARPTAVAQLESLIIGLALLFAVGVLTRAAIVALASAVTVWMLVRLLHTGTHDWMPLFVTLWATVPVRWGDGFSVDALVRRARGRPIPDRARRTDYGFALWVPGLVFGAAMASAGAAKLKQSGLSWITNGTVKYHFVTDAVNAPTEWGVWVARHHDAAVLLSLGAIVVECSLVLAVLVRDWRARLPFALMGLGLLGGFYVFQNEVWKPWWLMYFAFFVPWPALVRTLQRRASASTTDVCLRLAPLQIVSILAVLGLQIAASLGRFELAPIMSDYPMYSTTYDSIDEFQRRNAIPPVYGFSVRFADGSEADASAVFDDLRLDEPVRDAYLAVSERRAPAESAQAAIRQAAQTATRHFGRPVVAIVVLIDRQGFDWDTGTFGWLDRKKPVHTFTVE